MTTQDSPYQVVRMPAILDAPEQRGTRTKYWVRIGDIDHGWLLKVPRPGTGEHWAEKITAEVGHLIGVKCAQTELARFARLNVLGLRETDTATDRRPPQEQQDQLGSISRSFLPEITDEEVVFVVLHGWEVLQLEIEGYDTTARFGQRDHNIKNIATALANLMGVGSMNPMPRWDYAMEQLASYVLLDGLVGNTDRHHENWMIGWVIDSGSAFFEVMPSFDHASSLGRELTDDGRRRILESDGMERYLKRARGGLFVNNRRRRAPSPLRLARLLCRWRPGFTSTTLERINALSEQQIRTAIAKVPAEFMSDTARDFAFQVILTSQRLLLRRNP